MYDDYYWMSHFGDPGMHYTATLARIWAHMVIELASSPLLPLDFESYARELENYLNEWASIYDPNGKKSEKLLALIKKMGKKASLITPYIFDSKREEKKHDKETIQKINRLLIEIERDFTLTQGIPNRNWYKHLIFGARYTYAVLLFPALTEAAEAGDENGISQSIIQLEEAIKKATSKLKEISEILEAQ
ncbi:unnamed protein product [marine sediment metagenome]|uniref:Transferrin receptor-like dimerisation domain-containing protein n=1 Tax=marine sediment metagenome TaxID=412755 RepID=X0TYQ2_9ZZZZ